MSQQQRSPGFVTIRALSQPSGSVGPSYSLPTTVLQQVRRQLGAYGVCINWKYTTYFSAANLI